MDTTYMLQLILLLDKLEIYNWADSNLPPYIQIMLILEQNIEDNKILKDNRVNIGI